MALDLAVDEQTADPRQGADEGNQPLNGLARCDKADASEQRNHGEGEAKELPAVF